MSLLSRISSWASKAYTNWTATSSSGKSFAGFLADPTSAVTNFLGDKAVDWAKQSLTERMARYDQSNQNYAQMKYVSASSARTGVPTYSRFTSQEAQIPGMRIPQIRTAYDNLYNNSELLRVPNVQLTVQYTKPNIPMSDGTLSLGSTQVSKQKVKTTAKSALSRT